MNKRLDELERANPLYQQILTESLEEVIDDIKADKYESIKKDKIRDWLKGLGDGNK